MILTNFNPSPPDLGRRKKTNLNFYSHTSLWFFKKFYEELQGLHQTFCGTTKMCENKNLSGFLFQCKLFQMQGAGTVK